MSSRVAVNMIVLNGAVVLRRCLLPMKGAVSELVVVDTGSTDDTQHVVEDVAALLGVDRLHYELMHPYSRDFFTDEAASFTHQLPRYSGRRLLDDWAAARNRALDATTADYVVKLDADDEPLCPADNWLRTADYLDARPDLNLVSAPYEIYDGRGELARLEMYDRMWRRSPGSTTSPPRWVRPMHEYLAGKTFTSTLYAAQGLRVRDWRDSPGEGVRVEHRNLKVLLWHWEHGDLLGQRSPPSDETCEAHLARFTLAHEAAEVLPGLARELLADLTSRFTDVVLLSDCHYHLGRVEEWEGRVDEALCQYELADEVSPHSQALLRAWDLCRRRGDLGRAARLRDKILARLGAAATDAVPFNCDLGLVAAVRRGYSRSVEDKK